VDLSLAPTLDGSHTGHVTSPTRTIEPSRRRRLIVLGVGAYHHVAGVLGALALAAFASQVFSLDWRGILASAIGVWDEYVRPVARWLADVIVWPVERLFGWNIDVPVTVRDYFSVGLVLFLSFMRATNKPGERLLVLRRSPEQRRLKLWMLLACVVAWPIVALLLVLIVPISLPLMTRYVDEKGYSRDDLGRRRNAMVLTLLPLLYFALLVAANYLILA
jgi:hypothetical protein